MPFSGMKASPHEEGIYRFLGLLYEKELYLFLLYEFSFPHLDSD